MKTLTQSGAGVVVEPGALDLDSTERLRELVGEYRFVVLKRAFPTTAAAVRFMGRFGPLNDAETRTDQAVMVEESEEDEEVFRSRHALPLHKDGVLTGFDVVLIGIYCAVLDDVIGGRTYIADVGPALAELPSADVETLRERGVEGMAVDATGYYREDYEAVWHRFPAFRPKPGGGESLSIGMPHAEGEPESWRVRIADVGEEESDRILGALRDVFRDERFSYFHDWEPGDLLLIDNCELLHGREAWSGNDRKLANIQVLAG